MSPTSPKASHVSKTYPSRASNGAPATTPRGPARAAAGGPADTPWIRDASTTSAMRAPSGPATCSLSSPGIAAAAAAVASPPTWPTSPRLSACTPAAFSGWPCVWSSRTRCPTELPAGTCGAIIVSSFPSPPSRTGWRARGEKGRATMPQGYLDEALADFSGYLAIDEVYDGPFCVLSVVDNRRYRRLAFRVLDHDPTQEDVHDFLADFQGQLQARQRSVLGITTDGSPLYPKPLQALWPGVRHQVCEFHVLKEILKAVLHAVAKLRKELAAQLPKQPRGRPNRERQAQARQVARRKQRVADLFEHRHLFVRHERTPAQRQLLQRLTRGLPQLRTLRALVDEVYRLFDRRCKTATALVRLGKLRRRVRRLKRLGRTLD